MKRFLLLGLLVLPMYASTRSALVTGVTNLNVLGGEHPNWCKYHCPPGVNPIYFHRRNPSTGYTQVWSMQPDGTHQVCVSCTSYALTTLPQKNQGNPEWSADGNWIIFQAESTGSTLPPAQSVPGTGLNNGIWACNPAFTSCFDLAEDIPQTSGGYLQIRLSQDNHTLTVGHIYAWTGTTGVFGVSMFFRAFTFLEPGGVPTLTGTGIGSGIAGASPINYVSGAAPAGNVTCTATASGGTLGLAAIGSITSVGGSFAGQTVHIVLAGNGYSAVPTTFALSGAAGCSGNIVVSGGAMQGADFEFPDASQEYFVEAATSNPIESPNCHFYFSAVGSTTQAFRQYVGNLCATPPGPTVGVVSAGGVEWSEMGAINPSGNLYAFVSSIFTNITPPVTIANVALDLAFQSLDLGSRWPVTFFNTPGSNEYYFAGNYVQTQFCSFDPTGLKMICNLTDIKTFDSLFLYQLAYTDSIVGGQTIIGGHSIF